MEIVVCVKQVPDTTEVRIDPKTNTLIRQGVPSIINPFDKHALEAALALRDQHGGRVTVITMGPSQSRDALRECQAMGADAAVLLSDRAFGGADTLATSYTLSAGIRKLGRFDLILCGQQAIDGDTAQVGPEIAEHLGIPHISYASHIALNGAFALVDRECDEGSELLEVGLPALLTTGKGVGEPRYPSARGIFQAFRAAITVWTADDLDIDRNAIGLDGSPTQVRRIFTPERRTDGEIIGGDVHTSAAALASKLREMKFINE